MQRLKQLSYILAIMIASPSTLAVDFNHIFTKESITSKPIRSDYDSDAAFAADSLVYAIPRMCRYVMTRGTERHVQPWLRFNLGANLRKSSDSNWYANAASPITLRGSGGGFGSYLYVNADTGSIACGEARLERMGGDWTDGGKWHKTFDLVLKTKGKGQGSSSTNNIQSLLPNCLTLVGPWTNCFGTVIYRTGHEYVGEWMDRKRHGKGIYTYLDGRRIEGTWENGNITNKSKVTSPAKTAKKAPKPSSEDKAVKKTPFEEAKKQCAAIGLKEGTENFGNCVVKLMD